MSFLLDTDTCSAYIKGNALVFKRFIQHGGRLYISTCCLGELLAWALRAKAPTRRLQDIRDLLNIVSVLEVTQDAAWKFGAARAAMLDTGTSAPDLDLVNAAVALAHNLTVVTHNVQDYADIPGLMIVDWLVP